MPLDSTILDTNWETEDFSWNNNGDIVRKIWPDHRYISFINKHGEEVKISLLDLSSIWDLSDDEISEMLYSILWHRIQSPEWIAIINKLANRAYWYLKTTLLYTDQELRWIWNLDFSSSAEVIKFFKKTNQSQWLQKCMLAKIWLLLREGVWYDVEEKRKKTIDVLEKKVITNLEDIAKQSSLWFESDIMDTFKDEWKAEFEGSCFFENYDSNNSKKITFKVEFREKTLESTISKSLREKDYVNQWDIMDLLGIRITTKSKEDKVLLMSFISQLAFKYWEYRIKNKRWISPDDLEEILAESDYFTENEGTRVFIEKLEESFHIFEKRASTASGYSDVKIVPDGDGKLSFEIMFFDEGHKNDMWLAHHKPFEFRRKIADRIRLEWYITGSAITHISNTLISEIAESQMKELDWVQPTELLRQMLFDVSEAMWLAYSSKKLKSMKKIELVQDLKKFLPRYYTSKLIRFKDSKWRTSKWRAKYTNKVWIENLSVLWNDDIHDLFPDIDSSS